MLKSLSCSSLLGQSTGACGCALEQEQFLGQKPAVQMRSKVVQCAPGLELCCSRLPRYDHWLHVHWPSVWVLTGGGRWWVPMGNRCQGAYREASACISASDLTVHTSSKELVTECFSTFMYRSRRFHSCGGRMVKVLD